MSTFVSARPRRINFATPLLIGLAVISLIVLAAAIAVALGAYELPWQDKPGRTLPAGHVAVPISAQRISAYTRVSREQLWDHQNESIAWIAFPEDQLQDRIVRTADGIIGRVLRHDKEPGYVFTEEDFFPPGTRSGIVAGIPEGKRAMRVDAKRVSGFADLRPGDAFDLVATVPIDPKAAENLPEASGAFGAHLRLHAGMTNLKQQARVRVIVQKGTVVVPMSLRQVPTVSSSLTRGAAAQNLPVQEVVIAIDPAEVAVVTEALAVGADLTCVPRSGRPDDPQDSRTPNLSPRMPFGSGSENSGVLGMGGLPNEFRMVEVIDGADREFSVVPSR